MSLEQNPFTFIMMTITRDYERGWVDFKISTNISICMFVEHSKLPVLKLCVYFHLCSPRHAKLHVDIFSASNTIASLINLEV